MMEHAEDADIKLFTDYTLEISNEDTFVTANASHIIQLLTIDGPSVETRQVS